MARVSPVLSENVPSVPLSSPSVPLVQQIKSLADSDYERFALLRCAKRSCYVEETAQHHSYQDARKESDNLHATLRLYRGPFKLFQQGPLRFRLRLSEALLVTIVPTKNHVCSVPPQQRVKAARFINLPKPETCEIGCVGDEHISGRFFGAMHP